MNPVVNAARSGLVRGRIELRQTFTNTESLMGYFFPTAILLAVMTFTRGVEVPGTTFSLGSQMLPGALGMSVAFSGLMSVTSMLTIEREDGTLLRAKATPNGMFGYLIGKISLLTAMAVISLALLLVPGAFLLDGLALDGSSSWATLVWVVLLGMAATMPLGAIFGSLISNPREMGLIFLPIMSLVAASGIFYPITSLPGWLQGLAQVFPIYWLGLGMRSALLPADLAAVEIGHSWRHLETAGVLGAWAVVGLVLAPIVLRRMARRESGSSVAARREKAMQRVT
jgi:ABC-2 type transport system permease protein